nr:hypothetical protein [Chitinophagaceae bacterium]
MATNLKVLPWLYRSKINADSRAPIYLRITRGTQRIEIATGFFIRLTEWNIKTHAVKSSSPQSKQINEHLQTLRSKAFQIYNQLVAEEKPFQLAAIKIKLTGKDQKQTT